MQVSQPRLLLAHAALEQRRLLAVPHLGRVARQPEQVPVPVRVREQVLMMSMRLTQGAPPWLLGA